MICSLCLQEKDYVRVKGVALQSDLITGQTITLFQCVCEACDKRKDNKVHIANKALALLNAQIIPDINIDGSIQI